MGRNQTQKSWASDDTMIVMNNKPDQVVFRGQETLEDTMRRYDQSVTKMNDYVQLQCKEQIDAMKKAQIDLETKMKDVMSHKEMKVMEEDTHKNSDIMNMEMRRMQRELQRMEDDILENTTLDSETRELKLHTLHKAAISQYGHLSNKYPAAARAYMLSNIRMLQLHWSGANASIFGN